MLIEQKPLAIALYSSNSAKNLLVLMQQIKNHCNFSNLTLLCLSKNIANIFAKTPDVKIEISKHANDEAMMRFSSSIALAHSSFND